MARNRFAREDFGRMSPKRIGHSGRVIRDDVIIFNDQVHRTIAKEGFLKGTQYVLLLAFGTQTQGDALLHN